MIIIFLIHLRIITIELVSIKKVNDNIESNNMNIDTLQNNNSNNISMPMTSSNEIHINIDRLNILTMMKILIKNIFKLYHTKENLFLYKIQLLV